MSDLRRSMEQAALAWLKARVLEVGTAVGQPLAADLGNWLDKMPGVDRHQPSSLPVDDGHAHLGDGWYNAAVLQPPYDVEVCVRTPKGNLFRAVRCTEHGDIAKANAWRYI